MIPQESKIIAVDFDGTIAEDRYPGIGKPMPFAFETLKMLQSDGHRLILWTYRTGKKLNEAVNLQSTGHRIRREQGLSRGEPRRHRSKDPCRSVHRRPLWWLSG